MELRLTGKIELVSGEDDHSGDGLLVHARPEVLPALRQFRSEGGGLPIFVLASGPVTVADRLVWIREGADDLVPMDGAAEYLLRRVAEPWSTRPGVTPPPTGARIDRWLQASSRYVGAREALVSALGETGRTRYLDCVFHRDQVMRVGESDGATDVFGQRRGAERESLAWPVRVLRPRPGPGELENIGPDGACLALPAPPPQGSELVVEIRGDQVTGELRFEARWQRRVGRERWLVGVFTTACMLQDAGPTG